MKSKVLTVLLSVVVAFGLWMYVVTVVCPESEKSYYNIPVVLDGESVLAERNLMIISKKDLKVNLKLTGNRTDLNKLNSSNITLIADMTQITEPGEHKLRYTISYPGDMQFGAINVLNREPQHVTVVVAEVAKKEIPVKVAYTGALPEGYTADRQNAILDHTSVTVSGPKDIIDQIAQAKVTIDLTDRVSTITETVRHALCDEDGEPIEDVSNVTANVSDIRVTVKIQKLKEITLTVKVESGGGITPSMAPITMDRNTILVSGSEAALKDLNEIVLGTINLGELTESATLEFTINLPDGVTNVTGINKVTVHVEMPARITKVFTVTQFKAINVPKGKKVVFQTEQIDVEIRGPEELLNKLNPEDIIAVVDFKDAQDGSASYEAVIEIKGVEGVGAVGSGYIVNAQVMPQSEAEET